MNATTLSLTTNKAKEQFNSRVQDLNDKSRDFRKLAHALTLEALDLCQSRKETWKLQTLNAAILKMGAGFHKSFADWVKAVSPMGFKDGLWTHPAKTERKFTHREEKSTFWTYAKEPKPKAEAKPIFDRLESLLKKETGKEIEAITQAIQAIKSGVNLVPESSFEAFKAETLNAHNEADKLKAKLKESARELYETKRKLETETADSKRKLESSEAQAQNLRRMLEDTQAQLNAAQAALAQAQEQAQAEKPKRGKKPAAAVETLAA